MFEAFHVQAEDLRIYTHSYHAVEAAKRLVREGKKTFFHQYLLNPSADVDDVYFVGFMFVLLLLVRFILAGAHHRRTRHTPAVFKVVLAKLSKPKKESKMCENLWYSCWHTFSFLFGCYVLWTEGSTQEGPGWIRMLINDWDSMWYWFPTPAERMLGNPGWPLFPVSATMKTYYLTEFAFWLSCIVYLWIETIRDDFHALLLHHFVTCVLIGFSYLCSFWRIGTVILLTHDFADVILYTAKAIHYMQVPSLLVDALFLVFVCGFFMSRLVIFPYFCLRPALDTARLREWTDGAVASRWQIPGGITLPGFLCILQMLHIFWFGLILKMIVRTFKGHQVSQSGDIRSDDEDTNKNESEQKSDEEAEQSSGSESNGSSGISTDQRMQLSSLPGVRATTKTVRHRHGIRKDFLSKSCQGRVNARRSQ